MGDLGASCRGLNSMAYLAEAQQRERHRREGPDPCPSDQQSFLRVQLLSQRAKEEG
jgi:hypothetical protein